MKKIKKPNAYKGKYTIDKGVKQRSLLDQKTRKKASKFQGSGR